MNETQSIAVIGGVAAGTAAAAEARRVDPRARVVLFEKDRHISVGACEIPLLIEGVLNEQDLVQFTPESFEQSKGVQVRIGAAVTRFEPSRNRLTVVDQVTGAQWDERFDKFILATGARVSLPPVPNIDAANVFPVRSLDHATELESAVSMHPKAQCVVVGGGYIGLEISESLTTRGMRVTLLAPGGLVLCDYLGERLSKVVTDRVREAGVNVRDERLTEIVVDPANRVQAVATSKGERIGCKLLVLATGIVPDVSLAASAGIRLGSTGAIKVSETMATSASNVWACGDCVQVTRVIDDAPIYVPLSPVAYRTARVAARNAAGRGRGRREVFSGVCPASAVRAFGIEAASVGLTELQAREASFDAVTADIEQWSRVKHYPGAARIAVRFVVDRRKGRLLGAQLAGLDGVALRANVLVPLVRDRWTVDRISELDFVYNPPVSPPLDPLYVAAREAMRQLGR